MAKTAYSISMNYHKAMRQADNLDKVADSVSSYSGKVNNCSVSIGNDWKGDNAAKYIRQLQQISGNLEQIQKNVTNISETVRRIAKRTYDSEMASLEIAKKRTYR